MHIIMFMGEEASINFVLGITIFRLTLIPTAIGEGAVEHHT